MNEAYPAPKYRFPLLILLGAALLGSLYSQIHLLLAHFRSWDQIMAFLSQDATRRMGLTAIFNYFIDPILTLAPLILFLLYIAWGHRYGWGKRLVITAYGLMTLSYLFPVLQSLLLDSARYSELLPALVVWASLFAYAFATTSAIQGMRFKPALVAGPSIGLLYALYALFFITVPGIPEMLKLGASLSTYLLSFLLVLCSLAGLAGLILFGLTHQFPEKE